MTGRLAMVAVVAVACGDSVTTPDAGATIDTGTLGMDAGPTCADVRDAWHAAVDEAGAACDVASECATVGSPSGCDSSGEDIDGACGRIVNRPAYARGDGPQLEADWIERGCVLDGVTDCGSSVLECARGQCTVVVNDGCNELSVRSGTIVVSETFGPSAGAGIDVVFSVLQGVPRPAYDDRGATAQGCVVWTDVPRPQADEGAVSVSGTRVPLGPCEFSAVAQSYSCDQLSGVDLIEDGDTVTIAKPASDEVPQFEVTIAAAGAGFALDDASAPIDAVPSDGSAVSFSCAGAGGTCGSGVATLVRGRALGTAGEVATWRCLSFVPAIEVPSEAMSIILATEPTALDIRIGRFNLAQLGTTTGRNPLEVFVGTQLAGTTAVVSPMSRSRW